MLPLLTRTELDKAWNEACEVHRQYLEPHGVKLPKESSIKWVWVAVLFHFKGQCVHKDYVSKMVQTIFPDAAQDQQVRHLKRDGWYIDSTSCSSGEHKLDPYQPSPVFRQEQMRRSASINATDWADYLSKTGHMCFTCGAKEGQPDPRYLDDAIILQQGHKDPDKPINSFDDVVPQCQFCNRSYQNDFTFDDKGRISAVASVKPINRASEKVQKEIYQTLKAKYSNSE